MSSRMHAVRGLKMAPQTKSLDKVCHLHQHNRGTFTSVRVLILLFLLTLYLTLRPSPATCQETKGKTSFSSTSFGSTKGGGGFSKTNEINSGSKFREHIVQLQRKQQQQQQVVEQQQQVQVQRQEQVIERQQPVIQQQQRVVVEQSVDSQQEQQQQQQQQQVLGGAVAEQSSSSTYGSVKGTPGVDFPAYSSIPNTKFSCSGAPYDPGMYADETTDCQVYHLCYQGRRESFLCGVGTVFNQAIMNCDFWHSVECSKSSQYYNLNADFGKSSSEPGPGGSSSSSSSFLQQRILQQAQLPAVSTQQRTVQFESSSGFSGKTSPARVASSTFVGGTKTAHTSGTSIRDYQQFSSQRNLASQQVRPISPGRRVVQLSQGDSSNQFSSAESSPMRSITKGKESQMENSISEQVGSSLIVSNSNSEDESLSIEAQPTKGSTKTGFSKKVSSFSSQKIGSIKQQTKSLGAQRVRVTSGFKGELQAQGRGSSSATASNEKTVVNSNEENEVWKPYFKSKTKAVASSGAWSGKGTPGSGGPSSKFPSLTGSKSTSTSPAANGATEQPPSEASPATVARPDQEPNFGGGSSSSTTEAPAGSSGEESENPKIPKSSPPPPSESTSDGTTTPSPAAIESDVGSALSSTTPATESSSPPPPVEDSSSPPSDTTPAPTTTTSTTASPETTQPPAVKETTEAPQTTTTSSTTTTTEAPTTTSTTSPTSGTSESEGESENSEEMKKKRGVLAAGVEYVHDSNRAPARPRLGAQRSTNRANSSSVEYAKEQRTSAP